MNPLTMYVGLDISKLKHDVAAVDQNKNLLIRPMVIENCYEGFQSLLGKLDTTSQRLAISKISIGMEATADYWKNIYYFLKKQPQGYSVTVINPIRTRAYAKTELRRAKTDAVNAKDIACFMAEKNLHATIDRPMELENLRDIDKRIHQLKKYSTMLINKLRLELAKVAPEIESCISSFHSQQMLALLTAYPTAEHIAQASYEQLAQIRYGSHGRSLSKTLIEKIKTNLQNSIAYKTGAGSECVVKSLIKAMADNKIQIAQLQNDALALFKQLKGHESILCSIPGISRHVAIVLEAHIGDINRFPTSEHLVSYFGMNPTVDKTGKTQRKSHLQKKGEPLVRHKLFMAVLPMIGSRIHPIYPYYRRLVDSGKPKLVAMCAAMRKLLTIIYAMLKSNEAFDLKKT